MKVSVSFLKNKDGIENTLKSIDKTCADFIHVDILDGTFTEASNISLNDLKMFEGLKHKLDVHLMTEDPIQFILEFSKLNVEYITIQLEIKDVYKNLELIKLRGKKCGLAIIPETDIKDLIPYLNIIDNIIILGVHPGVGGSPLIASTINKINELKEIRKKENLKFQITFDGGVNANTIPMLKGVDTVVSGSYVVMSDNMDERIKSLK